MDEIHKQYTALLPGRELDRQVARVMGWKEWEFSNPGRDGQEAFRYSTLVPPEYDGSNLQHLDMILPHYSTNGVASILAWEWLEKNNPWGDIAVGRIEGRPSVLQLLPPVPFGSDGWLVDVIASGETYAHAIALAVVATRD